MHMEEEGAEHGGGDEEYEDDFRIMMGEEDR